MTFASTGCCSASRWRPSACRASTSAASRRSSTTTPGDIENAGGGCSPTPRRCSRASGCSRSASCSSLALVVVVPRQRLHHARRPTTAILHLAVTGLLFMIIGFGTFSFTLLLHATGRRYGRRGACATLTETSVHVVRRARRTTAVDRFGVWLSKRQIERRVGVARRAATSPTSAAATSATFMRARARRRRAPPTCWTSRWPTTWRRTRRSRAIEGCCPTPWPAAGRVARRGAVHVGRSSTCGSRTRPSPTPPGARARAASARSTCPRGAARPLLEFSAFRLGASARRRDGRPQDATTTPATCGRSWSAPGFRPTPSAASRHKFGLNTFAVCRDRTRRRTPP